MSARSLRAALAAFLFILAFPLAGGAQLRSSVGWTVEGVSIRGAGDSLSVAVRWKVSGADIPSTRAVVLAPMIQSGTNRVSLTPVSFYGDKALSLAGEPVSGNRREYRFSRVVGLQSFVTEDVIPYHEWMDTVSVSVSSYEWMKGAGLSLMSVRGVGSYVRSPRPEDPVFPSVYEAPVQQAGQMGYVRLEAPVHFREDSALVDEDGMESDSLFLAFASAVRSVTSSSKVSVRSGKLFCFVPPEGTTAQSDILSRNRSNALYNYLRSDGAFRYGRPERIGSGEDWDGLLKWTESTWFSTDGRLMDILTGDLNDRERMSLLRREKPVFWEAADTLCRPSLSRAVYEAVIKAPVFSSPEGIREFFQEMPQCLSAADFWRYASLYPQGSDYWLDVLLTGAYYHSDDVRLNRAVAWCLTERGSYGRAAVYLRNCGDDDKSRYAYAVWLYGQGRYGEMLDILRDLSYGSEFYRKVWESSSPFIKWYSNGAGWVRYYP